MSDPSLPAGSRWLAFRFWLRTRRLAQLALLVFGAGVIARVVRYALAFPLWGDESFVAVSFLSVPGYPAPTFADLFRPQVYGQIVPLLFMWGTLAVTKLAGLSEYALRLLPIGAGLAALPLFWRFARAEFGPRAALLALGFLAAAYYPIRHANELKPYSTDLLIALALTILAWGVWKTPARRRRWLALVLFAAVAPWASYPAAFVAGGVGTLLLWLVLRQRSALVIGGSVTYVIVMALSGALLYQTYAQPHAAAAARITEAGMWQETFPPIDQPLRLPLWLLLTHAGNMLAYPNGGKNGGSAATLILVAVGALACWRTRRPLLLLLLSPLAFNLAASTLKLYPYGGTARIMLYAAPAVCLLAGVGLFALLTRIFRGDRRAEAIRLAALLLAAYAGAQAIADVVQPFKKSANHEARRVIRELCRSASPADAIITFHALRPEPHAPWISPWKGDGALLIFYLSEYARGPVRWAPPVGEVQPSAGRTWLVVFRGRNYEEFIPPEQLERYLRGLTAALGHPEVDRHVLQRRRLRDGTRVDWQVLEIYAFGSPQ